MLRKIKTRINITPLYNEMNQWIKIEKINDDVVNSLLQSQFIGEGVYGFEMVIEKTNAKINMITPIIENLQYKNNPYFLNYNQNDNIACYDIALSYPSFLPLKHDTFIYDLQKIISTEAKLYLQILFIKRMDNWRDLFIDQYMSYLKGNDYPGRQQLIRNIQEKILSTLDSINGKYIKRERVNDIENKILENGYRVEIRLLSVENNNKLQNNIKSLLTKTNYFNYLELCRVKNTKKFINDYNQRKFSGISDDQIFSENELKSLLIGENFNKIANNSIENENKIETNNDKNTIQEALISLFPTKEKKNRIIDDSIKDKIASALKRVKIIKSQKVNITKIEQGSTLQKITMKIPDNINYSDIEKNLKNLKAAMGIDTMSIEQGDEAETISFLIPVVERETVYLKEILENEDFIKFAEKNILPFVIGVDILGNPIYDDLSRIKHLLVAGATGSGKSVFINIVIMSLLIMRKPSDVMLYLIDPKKVEFSLYKGFPHVQDVITDMNKANMLLKSLIAEMEKRYEILSQKNVRDIHAYNKKSKEKLPYIICVIDEFSDLIMTAPDEIEDLIIRIAQKARAAGIHLIIATQRPEADVLTGLIKANLPSKISLRLDSVNDYRTVFGKGIPYQLLGLGDGVMRLEGQIKEFERFQSPVISLDDEEIEKIYEQMKKLYKGEKIKGVNIVEIKEDEPIEKLKKIIATTNETRISKLREEMGIRMNDVQDLMQQLVEEGWLEPPKSKTKGYQLIASEEILNEWRNN